MLTNLSSYLSVYFSHYTDGTAGDLGKVMLVSAILCMIYNLYLCSMADSYGAHRPVYILNYLVGATGFIILLAIAFYGTHKPHAGLGLIDCQDSPVESDKDSTGLECDEASEGESRIELHSKLRFYVISACIIAGSISQTVNTCLADAFTTNISKKCGKSYGSIRSWGAMGWILASLVISQINEIEPFLVPVLSVYTVIATLNVLIVIFWPDSSPFDMSEVAEDTSGGTKFDFERRFSLINSTVANSSQDLTSTTRPESLAIKIVGMSLKGFDNLDESHKVRRSSQTPLDDTHMMEQYELNNVGQRFNYVTKIAPIAVVESNRPMIVANKNSSGCLAESIALPVKTIDSRNKLKGFRLNSLLVLMIIKRNKQVIRTLLMFVAQGFSISMVWYFLFPYLETVDENKFKSLSANIMIYSYVSELCFYYVSPHFLKTFSYSVGLSLILLVFALRYYLYIALATYSYIVPLDFIILVELLQAFNVGWYECIFNEASSEYALLAKKYVPELVDKGIIGNTQKEINTVNNGVKSTMVAVSSCCYDGIGVALGSFTGGYLIDLFGYNRFWLISGSIALSIGSLNLLLDARNYMCRSATTDNKPQTIH